MDGWTKMKTALTVRENGDFQHGEEITFQLAMLSSPHTFMQRTFEPILDDSVPNKMGNYLTLSVCILNRKNYLTYVRIR